MTVEPKVGDYLVRQDSPNDFPVRIKTIMDRGNIIHAEAVANSEALFEYKPMFDGTYRMGGFSSAVPRVLVPKDEYSGP